MTTQTKKAEIDELLEDWVVYSAVNQRAKAMFRDSLLASGSPRHATRATERFLEGTAVFEIDGDGSFEATVGTKRGVKYFSGVHAASVSNAAAATCRALENQIQHAFTALPAVDALREIDAVWNMAERTCELAAARSRLLLGKLPTLELADLPSWFAASEKNWDDEDYAVMNPSSHEAAKRIVQCIAAEIPELRADISVGMLGRIVLDWYDPAGRCSWMIEPVDLPFPAVRIYEARHVSGAAMQTRVIHDMYFALETLRTIASETDGI